MEVGRRHMEAGSRRNLLDVKKKSNDSANQKKNNEVVQPKNNNESGQKTQQKSNNNEEGSQKKSVKKIDVSLLQQPLQVSMRGVQMILKCMEDGTPEVKNLLLKECDVIFECKVCRSLFRGLPNLLSHKRSFCMKQYVDQRTDFPRENASDTCYVKPTEPDPEYADPEDEVTVAEVRARRGRIRDPILLSLSKNLIQPDTPPEGPVPVSQITDILPPNVKLGSVLTPQKVHQLSGSKVEISPLKTPFGNSSVLKQLASSSLGSISKAVSTLTSKLSPASVTENLTVKIENPEGDCSSSTSSLASLDSPTTSPNTQMDMLRSMKNVDLRKNRCLQCRKSFLQWQYLLSHMRTKHATERKLYKCSLCETVFQYTRSIGRHLIRRHKKSPKDIVELVRQIREQAITVKSESGSVKSGKQASGKNKGKSGMGKNDKVFSTKLSLITCRMCNKVFGKKSTRDNHEKGCYKRISLDNSGQPALMKRGRGRPRKSPIAIMKPGGNGPISLTPVNKPTPASPTKPANTPPSGSNRRKVGRPRKIVENVEESSDSSSDEDDVTDTLKMNGKEMNGKETPSPARRRGRPSSINRQTSSKSGSDGENIKSKAKGRPPSKSEASPPQLVAPIKKDPTSSPGKVKRTGYTERFEDIAQPYMDCKNIKCLVCGQLFLLKPALITHVCSQHLQMRRFRCNLCDWKALFKSEVVIHLRHKHHRETGTKVKDKLLAYVEAL